LCLYRCVFSIFFIGREHAQVNCFVHLISSNQNDARRLSRKLAAPQYRWFAKVGRQKRRFEEPRTAPNQLESRPVTELNVPSMWWVSRYSLICVMRPSSASNMMQYRNSNSGPFLSLPTPRNSIQDRFNSEVWCVNVYCGQPSKTPLALPSIARNSSLQRRCGVLTVLGNSNTASSRNRLTHSANRPAPNVSIYARARSEACMTFVDIDAPVCSKCS